MKNVWRSFGVGAGLIVLLTVIAYIPAMRGGFIWDDDMLITDNQMVKATDGLYRAWLMEGPDYYPLTRMLRWLEWRLWSNCATGYHVVNVLLHSVNAVLIWILLRRLKISGAWLVGLIFAVHPVNVAAVAWASEQKTTLSMLFYALAILVYLRFVEEGRWRWYYLSLATFLLALLSKIAVVMLPAVLLGCVWWLRGSLRWRDFLHTGPFFVCSLVLGLVCTRVMGGSAAPIHGPLSRIVTAGYVPWFYLYKALLPIDLSMIYPRWDINPSRLVSYLPGILLVGCFTLFWWKRKTWGRPLLFGAGYVVVTLVPVLGFFDQGFYAFSLVADHWQYYSIVGVIALAVGAGGAICRRIGEQRQYFAVAAGLAVLMAFGASTWTRARVYETNETLWRDTLAKNPHSWLAHNNLGVMLRRAGKLPEAIWHFEQALQAKPDYARAHCNLAAALCLTGELREAIRHGEAALRVDPDFAEAHNNLGLALSQAGRISEAIKHYEQALRSKPDYPEAQNNLAWSLATSVTGEGGDPVQAVALAERACKLTGDHAAAYLDTLAVAYAAAGRFVAAIDTAQKAIELARADKQPTLVAEIEARLQLYREGRAYHQAVHVPRSSGE